VTSAVDVQIGHNMRRLRVERGLGCTQLASLVGMSACALRAYESGEQRVPVGLFHQLALTLDVSIGAFFETQDAPGTVQPARLAARLH
jgi:transcriptional regulator with XRE-family HTH domain